jgi:hypothetical protein
MMPIDPLAIPISPGALQQRLQRSACGHRSRHIVQLPQLGGWSEICVTCWRRAPVVENAAKREVVV